MPTYEYRCNTCGKRFEYFQSITADPLTHCPVSECSRTETEEKGKGEVQRLISGGAGLVFKGEGFYLTDYARKGSKDEGGSSSVRSSSSAGSGSAPAEKGGSSGDSGKSKGAGSSSDSSS